MFGLFKNKKTLGAVVLVAAFAVAGCDKGNSWPGNLGRSQTSYQNYPDAKTPVGVAKLNEAFGCEAADDSCRSKGAVLAPITAGGAKIVKDVLGL